MNPKNGVHVLDAEIPLAEMFDMQQTPRSNTQGRATYSMQFDHYESASPISEKVIGERAKND